MANSRNPALGCARSENVFDSFQRHPVPDLKSEHPLEGCACLPDGAQQDDTQTPDNEDQPQRESAISDRSHSTSIPGRTRVMWPDGSGEKGSGVFVDVADPNSPYPEKTPDPFAAEKTPDPFSALHSLIPNSTSSGPNSNLLGKVKLCSLRISSMCVMPKATIGGEIPQLPSFAYHQNH
jgi:hypothetical protein